MRDYHAKYGLLREMTSSRWEATVFGNGVAGHGRPLVTRRPRIIMPGVMSFDPAVLAFQRALSGELNLAFPVDLDRGKFSRTGIHTSFDRLRTVSGYMMNPMSFTVRDNARYRASLGLSPGYTPVQRAIAENVWRLIFGRYKPAPVKVTKKSSGGIRRFSADHIWKIDYANFVYRKETYEDVMVAVDSGDWQKLANTYEIVMAMYNQKRDQVDTPGKTRKVHDYEYAISSGERGREFDADKKVVIEGAEYSDFSATRARVIHAGPWVVNCLLSVVSTGTMQSMFERYPSVFHVNTKDQVKNIIDGSEIYCSDVTDYDRSMSREAIDVPHDIASEFWDPRLIKLSRLMYFSAYYAKPLEVDGVEGHWIGDPREMSEQVICGNRSGHAWTSLIAKGNKVVDTLFVFNAMGLKVLGREEDYLCARGAINFVNNGDDEIIYSKSADLMSSFRSHRSSLDSGHYIVEEEDGQGYSGMLNLKTNVPLVYTPTPRIHTSFEKIYCPERDFGGRMRPFAALGIVDRINHRDDHPLGGRAWEIHDRLWSDMMSSRFGTMYNILANAMAALPFNSGGLTYAEKAVLEDPDKIHYRYLDSEIGKEVSDEIVSKVPYENFEHLVSSHYKGTLS